MSKDRQRRIEKQRKRDSKLVALDLAFNRLNNVPTDTPPEILTEQTESSPTNITSSSSLFPTPTLEQILEAREASQRQPSNEPKEKLGPADRKKKIAEIAQNLVGQTVKNIGTIDNFKNFEYGSFCDFRLQIISSSDKVTQIPVRIAFDKHELFTLTQHLKVKLKKNETYLILEIQDTMDEVSQKIVNFLSRLSLLTNRQ